MNKWGTNKGEEVEGARVKKWEEGSEVGMGGRGGSKNVSD